MASFSTRTALGLLPLVLPETGAVEPVVIPINWADAGAGVAVNDVVTLGSIPANHQIVDWAFISDDIDSNGTPTVAFSFGVLNAAGTALTDTWATGLTQGQTGGVGRATTPAAFISATTVIRRLGLLATGATATAQLAGRTGALLLFIRTV